jgi:hypothetical protein
MNEQGILDFCCADYSHPEPCVQTHQVSCADSGQPVVSEEWKWGLLLKSSLATVLEKYFTNGIRPDSDIDIGKLKYYYHEMFGKEIDGSCIPLFMKMIGVQHGKKIYYISAKGKNQISVLLDRLISEDNRLFFYKEFYEAYTEFFQTMNIFSEELLRTILITTRPRLCFAKNYFRTNSDITAESEILRCFAKVSCLSFEQLKNRLPYVPLDKIKLVLAQTIDYIRVNAGIYTHVSQIRIDKDECSAATRKVKAEIAKCGYATLASLDVSVSLELNSDLSEIAVRNGFFQVCLAACYEKRGSIITLKGTPLNTTGVFKNYCLSHHRLTLDELLNFEKELIGSVHSQSLFVAYDTMIRINKDTFVEDREISFDIETTDRALALFVHSDVIPLRYVTSFTSFPYIAGFPWNLFLLESYCKRFSRQFRYQCLSVNSRNVGAIFRKNAELSSYVDVLAIAVVTANVELNDKAIVDFLFNNGYIAQRTNVIPKVSNAARILREKGI